MAYSVSRSYGNGSPNLRANKQQPLSRRHHQRLHRDSPDWDWLDRWMSTKPWESGTIEDPDSTISRKSEDNIVRLHSTSSEQRDSLELKTKNPKTSILTRSANQTSGSSFAPSSESVYDKSSTSTSSASVSPTPLSSNTIVVGTLNDSNRTQKPSYMNPTESIKAKQKTFKFSSPDNMRRHVVDDDDDDLQYLQKFTTLSCEDTRSSADSNPSINFSRELYRPRHDCPRINQWCRSRRE